MKIVAFVWPGGAGKSTHMDIIQKKYQLPKSINYTTRQPRNPEDNDYIFVDKVEFINRFTNNELRNCVNFQGNLYGFHKDTFSHNQILLTGIIPQTIIDIKSHLYIHKWELLSIFFDLNEEKCIQRMQKRGDKMTTIIERVIADKTVQEFWPKVCDHKINTDQDIETINNKLYPIINNFFSKP